MYDAQNPTAFSRLECAQAVGQRATLSLTGVIVAYEISDAGPFVKFQPDERWGFADQKIGIDLDALTLETGGAGGSHEAGR